MDSSLFPALLMVLSRYGFMLVGSSRKIFRTRQMHGIILVGSSRKIFSTRQMRLL